MEGSKNTKWKNSSVDKRVEDIRVFLAKLSAKLHEGKYEEFLTIMKAYKEQRLDVDTVIIRLRDILKGNKGLINEVNRILPAERQIPHHKKEKTYNDALEFINRIREETKSDPSIYARFVEILQELKKDNTAQPLYEQTQLLLKDFPLLYEEFIQFAPAFLEQQQSSEEEERPPKKFKKHIDISPSHFDKSVIDALQGSMPKSERAVLEKLQRVLELNSPEESDYFSELIVVIEMYIEGVVNRKEACAMVEPLFIIKDFAVFINNNFASLRKVIHREEHKELQKYIQKLMNEFYETFKYLISSREANRRSVGLYLKASSDWDFSTSERHGHSYKHMPAFMPSTRSTDQDERCAELINAKWISVPLGSEDFSFLKMRKNPYEEALFKCEDERFELDMLIELTNSTISFLEDVQTKIESLPQDEQEAYKIPDSALTMILAKPIVITYGEHAGEFLEHLKQVPYKTIGVILYRLRQRLDTWVNVTKRESEKNWKDICEKNFYKSLDHRSFYFKQNEKRLTNAKSFIDEAKQRYVKRHQHKIEFLKNATERRSEDYEFAGGSRSRPFFSSFMDFVNLPHQDCADDELFSYEITADRPEYLNASEKYRLPEFRFLFDNVPTFCDALRIILFALPNCNKKVKKIIIKLYSDFLGIELPPDIRNFNVEFFLAKLHGELPAEAEEVAAADTEKPAADDTSHVQRVIDKWLKGTTAKIDHVSSENYSESVSDLIPDSMKIRQEDDFDMFLPIYRARPLIYVTSPFYIYFRFFYAVYERLLKVQSILQSSPGQVEDKYNVFLTIVCDLLKGNSDSSKFEEWCRSMLDNESYMLFTFDKLVNLTVKSLQNLIADDMTSKIISLFNKFPKNRQNEAMYLSEITTLTQESSCNSTLFRMLWTEPVLNIHLVESPLARIQNVEKSNAIARKLASRAWSPIEFEDEFWFFKEHLDAFYMANGISPEELVPKIQTRHDMAIGITDTCLKVQFVPETEDSQWTTWFIDTGANYLANEETKELLTFQDRNSFIQKLSEDGTRKFNEWHEACLSRNTE